MSFIINNQETFQTYSSVRNINTRNKHHHLHRRNAKLSCQKSTSVLAKSVQHFTT